MNRILPLIALLFVGTFSQACMDDHEHMMCMEECYDVCDVYCDAWGCEEYCDTQCYCADQPTTAQCYSNRDCYQNETCISGYCETLPAATAGLCESCTSHEECYEQGALCLTLSNDAQETVCGRACASDGDCPSAFTCVKLLDAPGSQCIPLQNTCTGVSVGCSTNQDCDRDSVCQAGECVVPVPECAANSDCNAGFVCQSGTCVQETPECAASSDCNAGFVCQSGTCVEETPECDANTACPSGESCVNGACVVTAECDANTPCPTGESCEAGQCVVLGSCVKNVDCAANQ
ncbi:MAG: hypothetical protein CO108_25690, partial [Deltaproteobacteria bacterium CG_4_9_14_3_um_filter_63_12]